MTERPDYAKIRRLERELRIGDYANVPPCSACEATAAGFYGSIYQMGCPSCQDRYQEAQREGLQTRRELR